MPGSTGRVFAGLSALAALWICVYWWWTPSDKPITGLDEPAPSPVDASPPAPIAQTPTRTEPPPAVIAPRFRDYTVRADDSFESIARRELGSSSYASAIAAANPFTSPSRLRAGQVIRIPLEPTNIQGKVADKPTSPALQSPPVAPTNQPPEAPPIKDIEYTIKAGDALSRIAKKYYGSTEFADFLFEYNRDRLGLTDKDSIRQGQVLLIPAKPAR